MSGRSCLKGSLGGLEEKTDAGTLLLVCLALHLPHQHLDLYKWTAVGGWEVGAGLPVLRKLRCYVQGRHITVSSWKNEAEVCIVALSAALACARERTAPVGKKQSSFYLKRVYDLCLTCGGEIGGRLSNIRQRKPTSVSRKRRKIGAFKELCVFQPKGFFVCSVCKVASW